MKRSKIYEKKFNQDLSTRFKKHIRFVMETLTNFVSCYRKVFIHMSIWIGGKDSMKHHYPQWKNFIVI